MINKNLIFLLLIFTLLISSSCFILRNELTYSIKYREKNETDELRIVSDAGNIKIYGWSKDIIDINTQKILSAGFETDLELMSTITEKSETALTIINRVPARVNGRIDIEVFVPYYLFKIYIESMNGDLSIGNFLGDIEITHNNGNIKFDFMGNLLRLNTYRANTTINVKSYNACDMIINKEQGNLRMFIDAVSSPSYLDVKTLIGDVSININKDIDHKLFLKNNKNRIDINYPFNIDFTSTQNRAIKVGRRGVNYDGFSIDISSESGKIELFSKE